MRGHLEAYFEAAFTAPDGVKRLRELILTLAVQGKLTEQLASDEPASELLKKISAEKKKLEKEGKIKKQKPLPPVGDDEKPYALPKGWEWARLGDICSKIGSGSTPRGGKETYVTEGVPFLRSQNVWNEGLRLDDVAYIEDDVHLRMKETSVQRNDILFNITGASLGRCALVPENFKTANVSQHVTIVRLLNEEIRHFIHYSLISPYYQMLTWARQVGMAREGLSKKIFEMFEIALPPLAEQQRIVERVNALMAQCDALEAMHKEQENKRTSARAAAMHALTMPQGNTDPAFAFRRNWGFLASHFEQLFTTKQDVAELRKTILQLAVMGKLSEQHASDEPASDLLKKISAEKKKLEKEGKIKKQKPLPPVGDNEKPYALPKGWEWVRLGEVSINIHYGYTASASEYGNARLLRITDIQNNAVDWKNVPFCDISNKNIDSYKLQQNDILIARTGGTIGKSYLVENVFEISIFASYLIRVIPCKTLVIKFLKQFLESPLYWCQLYAKSMGTGQPNVNGTSLSSLLIALPPLAEQQRIVERVNALMALCDTLEQNMDARAQTQTRLLDAVAALA